MSTLQTIQGTDVISISRTDINANFSALNSEKLETSLLTTTSDLSENSDLLIPSQKAVKTFVQANLNPTGASWNEYAADAGANDSYVITLTGVGAYATGQTFKFKANTANTGACTLNINGLGAKTIKKDVSSDLATGDILANQLVVVTYDGTNMQLINAVPTLTPIVRTYEYADSPATWTKPTGLKWIKVELWAGGGGGGSYANATGGGGGAYNTKIIDVASLGATETVTIGAGGARGSAGGKSSFGTHCEAYGGGAGDNLSTDDGGGGGGQTSVGSTPGAGGSPVGGAVGSGSSYAGGGGGSTATGSSGGSSYYGGGGGATYGGATGGASIYGGGGGGGATGGNGGTSTFGGAGGNGTPGNGTAGSIPGGGGGGQAAGGNGRVKVYEFY